MHSRGGHHQGASSAAATETDADYHTDSLNDSATYPQHSPSISGGHASSSNNKDGKACGSPVKAGGGGATSVAARSAVMSACGHSFVTKKFHRPTTQCHYCGDILWGLRGPGYICEGTFVMIL